MVIGLHERISGHPSRVRVLDLILSRLRDHDDVWLARKDQIARWTLRAARGEAPAEHAADGRSVLAVVTLDPGEDMTCVAADHWGSWQKGQDPRRHERSKPGSCRRDVSGPHCNRLLRVLPRRSVGRRGFVSQPAD